MSDKVCIQPGKDIRDFISGRLHSVTLGYVDFQNSKQMYTRAYKAGRISGHKEVRLTNLLNKS